MIRVLDGYPDTVLAVSYIGKVTAQDYHDVLVPEAKRRIEEHRSIRFLCHCGAQFDGLTAGAALADTKLGLVSRFPPSSGPAPLTTLAAPGLVAALVEEYVFAELCEPPSRSA